MNMKGYIVFLLIIWKKQKMNVFYKYEHKNKISFFSTTKMILNLDPRS